MKTPTPSTSLRVRLAGGAMACALGIAAGVGFTHLERSTDPTDRRSSQGISTGPASAAGPQGDGKRHEGRLVRGLAAAAASAPSSAAVGLWELGRLEGTLGTGKPLTTPNWRIVGTTVSGTNSHVLILFEGSQVPEARKVGEPLPGGAKVLAVDGQQVEVLYQGQRLFLFTGTP